MDILKDRLYVDHQNSLQRQSAQTVLFELVNTLCSLMAPVLSFLAEETYRYVPGKEFESIFLKPFPQTKDEWKDEELDKNHSAIFEVRSEILKKIEELRAEKVIRASLEAKALSPVGAWVASMMTKR